MSNASVKMGENGVETGGIVLIPAMHFRQQKAREVSDFAGLFVVGTVRIELTTPAMSTQCSTTELRAHTGRLVERRTAAGKPRTAFFGAHHFRSVTLAVKV